MSWGRLHDGAHADPKLLALSDAAHRMWSVGVSYCQAHLTDGFIPDFAIYIFGVRVKDKEKVADELCQVLVPGKGPLWHQVDGGYRMHDYHDWNDTADKIKSERERSRKRVEKHRTEHRTNGEGNAVLNALRTGLQTVFPTMLRAADPRTTYVRTEKQEHAQGAQTSASKAELAVIVRQLRRERSRETPDWKPAMRVIVAVARHVIAEHPDLDDGEIAERIKRVCARANLNYTAAVGPAIDRARAQLLRKRRTG